MIAKFEAFLVDYGNMYSSFKKKNELEHNDEIPQISKFFLDKEDEYFIDDTVMEYPILKVLDFEKELLGIYVSGNPFDIVSQSIQDRHITFSKLISSKNNAYVLLNISAVKKILTKNKDQMAFVDAIDADGIVKSVTLFPNVYERYQNELIPNEFVLMMIVPKFSERGIDLLVSSVRNLHEEMKKVYKIGESKNNIKNLDIVISEPMSSVRFSSFVEKVNQYVTTDRTGYQITLKQQINNTIFKLCSMNCLPIDIPMLRSLNKFQGVYLSRSR